MRRRSREVIDDPSGLSGADIEAILARALLSSEVDAEGRPVASVEVLRQRLRRLHPGHQPARARAADPRRGAGVHLARSAARELIATWIATTCSRGSTNCAPCSRLERRLTWHELPCSIPCVARFVWRRSPNGARPQTPPLDELIETAYSRRRFLQQSAAASAVAATIGCRGPSAPAPASAVHWRGSSRVAGHTLRRRAENRDRRRRHRRPEHGLQAAAGRPHGHGLRGRQPHRRPHVHRHQSAGRRADDGARRRVHR